MYGSPKNTFLDYQRSLSMTQSLKMVTEERKLKPVRFHKLFRFVTREEKIFLVLGILCALFASVGIPIINLVYGEFANILVDRQCPKERPSTETTVLSWFGGGEVLVNASYEERMSALDNDSVALAVSVAVFSGLTLLFLALSITIFNFVAFQQINRIRIILFKSILSQSKSWFDVIGNPNFSTKISEDLTTVQNGIGEGLVIYIYLMAVTANILTINFIVGWLLTMVLLFSVFPVFIVFFVQNKIESKLTINEVATYNSALRRAQEVFSNIRTVHAFGGEEKEIERYRRKLYASRSIGILRALTTAVGVGVVWFVIYCCYAIGFAYGFRLIIWTADKEFEYTPDDLIVIFFGVLTAAVNLSYSGSYLDSFARARGSAASVFWIIDKPSEINPFSDKGDSGGTCNGEIVFRNVHFHYPSRPETEILNGLNLTIHPGETVAIIGGSGSGKSTVLQLIQRVYDPVEGEVLLDGVDLKYLNISWLRRQLGVVLQEPSLFSTTIGKNIAYGAIGAAPTDEEIIGAAKRANAHRFIINLHDDYDTQVGGKGSKLSGGQKQRIAIARALIRDPKILLLDEATSALDPESEKLVQETLNKAAIGRTTVIVTHKLSTLTNVQRIIVLAEGKVAEEGSFDELVQKEGIFSSLLAAEAENLERARGGSDDNINSNGMTSVSEDPIKILPNPRGNFFSTYGGPGNYSAQKLLKDESYIKVSCFKFLEWSKPDWIIVYFGIIASIILGFILPSVCLLFGEIVGLLTDVEKSLHKVDIFSLIFVSVGVVAGLFSFMQMYFLGMASIRLTARMRMRTFEAIISQEIAWFDSETNNVSTLCGRLTSDCGSLQGVLSSRVGVIIQGVTAMLICIIVSMFFSWKLALVSSAAIPLIFFGIYLDLTSTKNIRKMETEALQNATVIGDEAINNIKMVNCLGKERFFLEEFIKSLLVHSSCEKLQRSCLRAFAFSLGQTAPFFGYSLSLWYGGYLVHYENLPYKEVIRVSELLIYGAWVLGQALVLMPNFGKAKQAARRLQGLYMKKPKIQDGHITVPPNLTEGDEIEFSNVYFAYPTRPDVLVLRNIQLTIKAGESVALVGPSGSGKSSIIQLLLRFYDPNAGVVTVKDVKIKSYKLTALRRCMGLVSQEPVLFDRTVYENIAYGDNGRLVPIDEVVAAAKAADIHSFISSLPMGYYTRLGSSYDTQLSGGQKQRIAIARVMVRNPQILLLDEATSALDPQSERTIQGTLDNAMAGRTTITIAHRLGAALNADVIYVIDHGQIVESGTHFQLMKQKGFYYRMHSEHKE